VVTDQERARHLALNIWLNCKAGSEFNQELAGTAIEQAFQAVRREAYEEAAQAVDFFNDDPGSFSEPLQRLIVERFRAKAKEAR
jgi:8-oxo-dGTP pyrophosphatase MutT (NUDIX family)